MSCEHRTYPYNHAAMKLTGAILSKTQVGEKDQRISRDGADGSLMEGGINDALYKQTWDGWFGVLKK